MHRSSANISLIANRFFPLPVPVRVYGAVTSWDQKKPSASECPATLAAGKQKKGVGRKQATEKLKTARLELGLDNLGLCFAHILVCRQHPVLVWFSVA